MARERERESGTRGKDARGAGGYRHKGQLKSQSSGPNYVEKRGGVRARSRAPIYNKMKAIRGDNPRTTNQRVYLMPVVPPPPPEKPPMPDVEQFSLSFPLTLCSLVLFLSRSPSASLSRPSIYLSSSWFLVHVLSFVLSLYTSLSLFLFLFPSTLALTLSFILSVHHSSLSPPILHPLLPPLLALVPASSRCCSRICHYATDITNPLSPPRSSSRPLSRVAPPHLLLHLAAFHPRVLFATCRTLAHPRDLAQSVLLY